MMLELFSIDLALSAGMMTTVRLATGGVCSHVALSYDEGEDCKVCVTESLLLLMRGGYRSAHVSFSADASELYITVKGTRTRAAADAASAEEDEIALALINALAQQVTMEQREGAIAAIAFAFGKQE